jgi:hypothetical protein
MLTKAIVLIIIGSVGGNPKAAAVGPFEDFASCRDASRAIFAAAMVEKRIVAGICVQTPFSFTDHQG